MIKTFENEKWEILDFVVAVTLSGMSLYYSLYASIAVLVYFSFRIIKSNIIYSICPLLLFCTNTNIFSLYTIPVCNMIILVSLVSFIVKKKYIRIDYNVIFLVLYELFHIVVYSVFNSLQCIVWCMSILFPVIYLYNVEKFDIENAKKYFINGTFISTIYGCIFRLANNMGFGFSDFNTYDNLRFGGGMHDANYYALMNLIASAIIFYDMVKKETSISRIVCDSIKIIILLLFSFLSLSRMFFLILLVVLLLITPKLIININNKRVRIFIGIMIVLFVSIALFKIDVSVIINKILDRFKEGNVNEIDLSGGRLGLANQAITFLIENPLSLLLGVGVQSYGARIGTVGYIHNTFLELFVSFGIIGTVLFVLLVLRVIKHLKQARCKTKKNYWPIIILLIGMISLNSIEVEIFYTLYSFMIVYTFEPINVIDGITGENKNKPN